MEEIFARRKARLMELRARRKGEDGEPKRLAARPVFDKCPSCGAVVPKTELSHSLYVCTKCGYHHTIGAYLRLAMLLDSKSFRELDQDLVAPNVLGFPGYEEKLERQRDKTGLMEAVVTARGRVEGRSVAAAALDSRFFMGSMGAAVGEKVTRCVEYAQRNRLPLIIFSASGGARLQGGIISLMKMAKNSAAIRRFWVHLLSDPPHHRRGHRFLRLPGGHHPGGAGGPHRLCRPPGHRADHRTDSAGGVPALGVPGGARLCRPDRPPGRDAGHHLQTAAPARERRDVPWLRS